VLHDDLETACLDALKISPSQARRHAEKFSWAASTEMFAKLFVKAHRDTAPSHQEGIFLKSPAE